MTPETQNIAIALACGWKWYRWGKGGGLHLLTPHHDWTGGSMVPSERVGDEEFRSDSWPDYLSDLNAMHEAEKVLTIHNYAAYEIALCEAVDYSGKDPDIWHNVLCATAAQRAEAFLRAKGLWQL